MRFKIEFISVIGPKDALFDTNSVTPSKKILDESANIDLPVFIVKLLDLNRAIWLLYVNIRAPLPWLPTNTLSLNTPELRLKPNKTATRMGEKLCENVFLREVHCNLIKF